MSERYDRRLLRESAAARPHFVVATAVGVVSAVLIVAQAALLARIVDRAAFHHASVGDLKHTIVWLGIVFVLRALASGAFELSGRLAAFRVLDELRGKLARRLLIERPGLQGTERTGELATVAVQGVGGLEDYFAGYLPSLVLATVVPVAVLIWVIRIDWVSALILAITIPVLIGFMIIVGLRAQSVTMKRWRSLALLSSHFLDVVRGLETLRAFRREDAQAEILAGVGERYRKATMGTLRIAFLSSLILELCAMIGTAMVAATIGVQLTTHHLHFEAGFCALLLAPELYSPLRQVGAQFHASADGLAAVGQILDVLDKPASVVEPENPQQAPDPRCAAVEFTAASVTYPDRSHAALEPFSLTMAPGEVVALIGPSGAGKTTVARLALRLQDPTAGRVLCGGTDLRDLASDDWRRLTGYVPQKVKLFAGTLAANIALAQPDATTEKVDAAARSAGLGTLIDSLPEGLETIVGDGGRRLSGGESQRVALARVFLSDASLVVLDEPTANLDPETSRAVGEAIIKLAEGRTMLLITHDRELAKGAHQTIEMELVTHPGSAAGGSEGGADDAGTADTDRGDDGDDGNSEIAGALV